MKKITQTLLLATLSIGLLASCGNKDDDGTQEAASLGEIVGEVKYGDGVKSNGCPDVQDPVCVIKQEDGATIFLTYRNACDAEYNNEESWTKGECEIQ